MTTQELLEYLNACLNAEQAIFEIQNIIDVLTQNFWFYSNREHTTSDTVGIMPQMETLEDDPRDAIHSSIDTTNRLIEFHKKSLITAPETPVDTIRDMREIKRWKAELAEEEKRLADAERAYPALQARNLRRVEKYEHDMAEYKRANEVFRKTYQTIHKEADKALADSITVQIQEQTKRRDDMNESLSRLYGMGILYKDFRNAQAIVQLIKYLEMGVAEQLTGPDGAYRVYLEDLRTEKIVGAIGDLRVSMELGFSKVIERMDVLSYQIAAINDSLHRLRMDVKNGFDTVSRTINSTASQIVGAVSQLSGEISSAAGTRDEILRKISQSENEMREIIRKSAYNAYIIERKENVDNYLFRMLEKP